MTDSTDSTDLTASRPLTLMTIHAHPDDETIGTGGSMAKAVKDGRRVVLVTGTRGEMGEIVVPEMDTPENHRRLGELRAAELEAAMGDLGVTEWENLGLSRLGHDGPGGEPGRAVVLAGRPRRGRAASHVARPEAQAGRHDDLQRLRRLRSSRSHPDARRGGSCVRPGRRSDVVSGAARRGARRDWCSRGGWRSCPVVRV